MEKRFYKHWFGGFESALENMAPEQSSLLLLECGKACSRSYSQSVYEEEFSRSESIQDFTARLQSAFPDMKAAYDKTSRTVEIIYSHCMCNLVTDGLVTSPMLCGCSQQSLKHNWESVFGKGSVETEMKSSILKGDKCCRFIVRLSPDKTLSFPK